MLFNLERKVLVLLTLMGSSLSLFGQTLTVREVVTHDPVPNVSVTWPGASRIALTDEHGQVEIGLMAKNDVLVLSHPSFETMSFEGAQTSDKPVVVYIREKVVQIDEVVVTAERWKQDRANIPDEVVMISSRDVVFNNPQTSADMLAQTGKVFMQKSQLGGGSPMVRGFAANSVLITLDGIRLNNAIYRDGNLQNVIAIDPMMLDETEVLLGPASTLYGSDALGGVMNFKTRQASYSLSNELQVQGHAMTRYASASMERTVNGAVKLYNSRICNISSVSFSQYGDLRAGSVRPKLYPDFGKQLDYVRTIDNTDLLVDNTDQNFQRQSGYGQWNILNKLSIRVGKKSEVSHLLYYSSTTNVPRYDRLIIRDEHGVPESAEWYYGPQTLLINALSFASYNPSVLYDQIKFTISTQLVRESRNDRKFGSMDLRSRQETVNIYALNIDLDKKLGTKSELFYGGEGFINYVQSKAYAVNIENGQKDQIEARYPEGGSIFSSAAIYTNLIHKFSERFVLNSGVRYTWVGMTQKSDDDRYDQEAFSNFSQSNGALSGKIGVIYRPFSGFKWNGLISTGFRAPNIDDMGKVFDTGDVVVVPNSNLRPEHTINYETGLDWKVNGKLRFEGSSYYTRLIDGMVRMPFEIQGMNTIMYDGQEYPMAALTNTSSAEIYGYSLGVSAAFGEFMGLKAVVNQSFGQDITHGTPLRHTHPLFGMAALTCANDQLKAEIFTNFQGPRKWEDLAPEEQSKRHLYTEDGALGWATLNIRTSYQFNPSISLSAALENILDSHYRPYSSGISAPGINGILSARYQF